MFGTLLRYRTSQGSIVLMESARLVLSFDLFGSSHFKIRENVEKRIIQVNLVCQQFAILLIEIAV